MEEPLHKGTTFPVDLPTRYTFTSREGPRVEYAAKVKNPDVPAFVAQLQAAGVDFQTEPREGNPITIVSWATADPGGGLVPNPDTIIADIYELVGNDIEKSLWELPLVKNEFLKITGVDWYEKSAFVKRLVEDKIRGAATTVDNAGNEVSLNPNDIFRGHFTALGLNADIFANLIASMSAGVEVFYKSAFVLRRTRRLPPVTNLKPSIDLANLIFTDAQLIALLNPPLTITFSIPPGFWQYKTPSMTQQQDGTWQLLEEFWWADAYDPFIYQQYGA